MTSFKINKATIELEKQIKHCELKDLPIDFTRKVGEGAYALVHNIRNSDAAIKLFKQPISLKKTLGYLCKDEQINS